MNTFTDTYEFGLPVYDKWLKAVNAHNLNGLMELYDTEAVFLPAFSLKVQRNRNQIKSFFKVLFKLKGYRVIPYQVSSTSSGSMKFDIGKYKIKWFKNGRMVDHDIRFSMIITGGRIMAHHACEDPNEDVINRQVKK